MEWVEPILIAALFILTTVGGWIGLEIRRLHARIDKRDEKWEERWTNHEEESRELHKEVTENTTKIDMHLGNGHRHKE